MEEIVTLTTILLAAALGMVAGYCMRWLMERQR